MRIGPYRFRPTLLPTLATLLVLPVLVSLGLWQLDRAQQKREMYAQLEAGRQAEVVDLSRGSPEYGQVRYRRAVAEGRWEPKQFLLDNQLRQGRPGYQVLTPLRLPTGDGILVDRGWVPAPLDRESLPDVSIEAAEVLVAGIVDRGPSVGLRMGEPALEAAHWPQRLAYLDYDYIQAELGYDIRPYLIHLDPKAPDGYRRDWEPAPEMPAETHLGYAFQWFALSAALVVIYVVVNLKRSEESNGKS